MKKDYLDYLQSSKWLEKRIERLKMDNFRCCRCGSPHDVQVHHLTYKNIGNENVYEDLITLCDSCHESIEKEAISGCEYTKPIKYGNNFGVAKTIPLPANCAIIYTDMKDLDARKQLQLNSRISYGSFFIEKSSIFTLIIKNRRKENVRSQRKSARS